MSMIFQNIALIPWKTALENVKLAIEDSKMSEAVKERKCMDALEQVKLQGIRDRVSKRTERRDEAACGSGKGAGVWT
jgi:ABC-type nitrate/sulfonate/bicarbonate transport system ATPase subunit